MSKKKIAVVISVITILLALVTAGTYAAVTRSATARNVITTGKIAIALEDSGAAAGTSDPIPVLPGVSVDKATALRNVDATQPAYVRARVDVEIRDIVNWPVTVTPEELASIILLPTGSGWVEKDGWLYYETELKPGQTTGDVFSSISFADSMPNKFQNCTATVTVTAQAVQVKNNGATVFEALGWPAE